MENYFKVLNISEDAEKEVIIASYKALAKKYHPDACKIDPQEAARRMALINEAYEVLSDDRKRAAYLAELHASGSASSEKYTYTRNTENHKEENPTWNDSKDDEPFHVDIDLDIDIEPSPFTKGVVIAICIVLAIAFICSFIHFGLGGISGLKDDFTLFVDDLFYNFHLK